MAASVSMEDIHGLMDVAAMTRMLHETIAKERAIEGELEELLASRADVERRLMSLQAAAEVLELVATDADAVMARVSGTCRLAEQVNDQSLLQRSMPWHNFRDSRQCMDSTAEDSEVPRSPCHCRRRSWFP